MAKLTTEELRSAMDLKHNIRHMSVIGHRNHGKSTLADSLVAAASTIAQEVAESVRISDTRIVDVERSITIKSTSSSLYYEMPDESLNNFKGARTGNTFLINLIDSPRHVDFPSEATNALRITDGALVVVECIEGVCLQTELVLRQALGERIRPVLTVNKIDRCFLELQVDGEEAYQTFQRVIENANAIMATHEDPLLGDVQVYPEMGTVAFSAGLHGWAFTLTNFAKMYASKFGVDESKMMERLWGDNYFDAATKKWTNKKTGSPTCKRGFVQFCYEPIKQIIKTCMNDEKAKLWPMLERLGVTMKGEEKELIGKALVKRVMQTWLPASTALLEMIIFHLPSPATAQRYRVENLYEGPLDDQYANAIRNCDPEGPLMLFVSKMIPAPDKGRFFAFGRVFAGKVSTGMKVRFMGPNYVPGLKKDLYSKSIQRIVIMMGKGQESVDDVPCGNTLAMLGLDQFILKTATLANDIEVDAHTFRAMRFSVTPVVRVAVNCKFITDLPKVVEGLKRLSKSDPMVVYVEESGLHIVAGPGARHLEIFLKKLIDYFMGEIELLESSPVAIFRETVLQKSSRTVISRSSNNQNRLYMEARPLEEGLVEAIQDGRIGSRDDPVVRSTVLSEEFGWNRDIAKKIWCFGPATIGPNMVVDLSDYTSRRCSVKDLRSVKESVTNAFQEASCIGALCNEGMQGICFELNDAEVHPKDNYRRNIQVIPMARKSFYASQLTAQPRLVQPIYKIYLQQIPQEAIGNIYEIFTKRKGSDVEMMWEPMLQSYKFEAFLPVAQSFGIENEIGAATSGRGVFEFVFDHWAVIFSDPFEVGSEAWQLVAEIRLWKGLKEDLNQLSDYYDKD